MMGAGQRDVLTRVVLPAGTAPGQILTLTPVSLCEGLLA